MKKFSLLFILFILPFMAKSKDKEEPYLVKTKDFKVTHFGLKKIDLGITAVIFNPYKAKIKIEEIKIDVFIEGKKLGTIYEAADVVKMPKESAFDLPLKSSVITSSTLSKFFTEGAKLAVGKKVKVDYSGYVKVKALGFIPIKVKIDDTEYFTKDDILGTTPTPTPAKK